jgi:CheY-like chemotaxis protein
MFVNGKKGDYRGELALALLYCKVYVSGARGVFTMSQHILLLDDQKDLLSVMERELNRRAGFEVTAVSSITEAMDALERNPIDILIADVRLGAHSGFTFAESVRQNHPHVGVILMSAYRSKANHSQAQALGAYLFLEKPFPMSKLVQAIESYFTARTAAQRQEAEEKASVEALPTGAALAHFQAQDLVQIFCLNGRAIVILVKVDEGRQGGCIYIQKGNVRHAEMGDLTGDEAFYALLALDNAELSVSEWDRPVLQTIDTSWERLLLTAAVRKDGGHVEGEAAGGFSALS